MFENDTVKLLRECDAGIKMGISSLDNVISSADDYELEKTFKAARQQHTALRAQAEVYLSKWGDKGKDPYPISKKMSKMKTKAAMLSPDSDRSAAKLITKGCRMGIKSLTDYKEQYPAADRESLKLADSIIGCEQNLIKDLEKYL